MVAKTWDGLVKKAEEYDALKTDNDRLTAELTALRPLVGLLRNVMESWKHVHPEVIPVYLDQPDRDDLYRCVSCESQYGEPPIKYQCTYYGCDFAKAREALAATEGAEEKTDADGN